LSQVVGSGVNVLVSCEIAPVTMRILEPLPCRMNADTKTELCTLFADRHRWPANRLHYSRISIGYNLRLRRLYASFPPSGWCTLGSATNVTEPAHGSNAARKCPADFTPI